jgi:Cytochrome P460
MRALDAVSLSMIAGIVVLATHGHWESARAFDHGSAAEAVVDARGNLHVPDSYRTSYRLLGSWAIAADDGKGSKELHVVLVSPGAIDAHRNDGHFPDGTVLVKEVYSAVSREMTTGSVSRADGLKGWFVMVKGDASRFPGNALWGDGWGWSWFDATASTQTTSTNYRLDCKSCHVPAQASEWVYVDGYPALKR